MTNSQTTQVRALQPLTITTTHSPSTGNRTFLLSPSPTTSTDSYRPWMGTTDVAPQFRTASQCTNPGMGSGSFLSPTTTQSQVSSTASLRSSNGTAPVAPQLRTLSGFPWQIPGDSGAGYEGPDLDNDSSLSSIPTGSSTDVSYSTPASNTSTTSPSSTSCCALCPLLAQALRSTTTYLRNTLSNRNHRTPPPTPSHPPTSIETSLLQIHLHTLHTTPLRFLHWSFGYFSLHRAGSNARVQFPEQHYAHLPIRAVVSLVAMDLDEGVLAVEGDAVEGDVAWSLGVEARGLLR